MTDGTRPADLARASILRYSVGERINHWLVALAFICAALSGLALFHPALFWLSALFGGGPWTRILHPFIGLTMLVLFLFLAAATRSDNRMRAQDWQWLRQIDDVVHAREERLPEVGRNNAGQKLVFIVAALSLLVLVLTGLAIWRVYFSGYLPITLVRWSALLHAFFAFVLICTIITHIYAAIWVKGSIRAMTRGTVTPGWAWKHHRAWYREILTHASSTRPRPD
jgi:formate dehydrogenase subunit gamma